MNKLENVKQELFVLGGIIMLPISLGILLWLFFGTTELDFQVHDTYFVTSLYSLIGGITLPFLYLVYAIKEGIKGFRNLIGNIILLIFNALILLFVFLLFRNAFLTESLGGGVIYPPLEPNNKEFLKEEEEMIQVANWAKIVIIISLLITGTTLALVTFRTIKILKKEK